MTFAGDIQAGAQLNRWQEDGFAVPFALVMLRSGFCGGCWRRGQLQLRSIRHPKTTYPSVAQQRQRPRVGLFCIFDADDTAPSPLAESH